MARYSSFMGRRVEVHYRASDTLLPASGIFVADSGRSIFLEQIFEQRGQHRHFRWEIPYQYLVKIGLSKAEDSCEPDGKVPVEKAAAPEPASAAPEGKLAAGAAAGMGMVSSLAPGTRPKPA